MRTGNAVKLQRRPELTDDLDALLAAIPPEIAEQVRRMPPERELIEVVLDLGRRPEARFGSGGEEVLLDREVTDRDIQWVVDHIGSFGDDNRAGVERTLHRISAIRNRSGKIVGLTCRVGRAVFGTIEIIEDLVESGRSVLIMGRPGIGKTTMLREAARVLADDLDKRVVVVDTSNEIAGDGDIPHPGIGRARRMQVPTPALQHAVMIEAVENHMPEVIVIDEIGTELEAMAARTIAERGVQLIGTAHGNNLDNLMLNPTLSDLIGGIQSVTLGDEEARRRRTQKSVLERKAPPTFDIIVEIQDRDRVIVHPDVAETVDAMLRGDPVAPELRWRDEGGVHRSQSRPRPRPAQGVADRFAGLVGTGQGGWRPEPGWRGESEYRTSSWREPEAGYRSGYRPGTSGGWRASRGRGEGGRGGRGHETEPGSAAGRGGEADRPPYGSDRDAYFGALGEPAGAFRSGEIADRGPLERGTMGPVPDQRARDAREIERHRAWRESAARALESVSQAGEMAAEGRPEAGMERGTSGPAKPPGEGAGAWRGREDRILAGLSEADREGAGTDAELEGPAEAEEPERAGDREVGEAEGSRGAPVPFDRLGPRAPDGYPTSLPTIRVLGFGVSRKKLEQSIRELQLPVVVVQDADEAEVVITLRNYYRQKPPALREAEERALPIYVLKSNTIIQMEACLTSLYAIEVDPREAALRETEEAIGLVLNESRPVELSPQNAYIRRLQHQMAERANVVSQSRGREPYRRVRLYPDRARAWR
jgi:stage III sporulation protein SpoIIIAA